MKQKIVVFFITAISTFNIYAQKSMLHGKVEDAANGEPLIGVSILVNELENTGTTTDDYGNYTLKLPVGVYSIKVSYIGYSPVVKTDIVILSGRETWANIKLTTTAIALTEVTVKGDYFDKSMQLNNLATVVLSPEEIRRSPGSDQDFQRILQAMPGVSFSNDQNNELLVRGGSPNENLTVFDEMELHSTNHYPNEFNSGGPINMINVDLIENIQFSTGGFISKFGDKLSSVMQVTTREGTRNSIISGNANISMAGYGGVFEGKINEGKGSWLISARKSYINLIAGAFGLTAIPYYYDFQFKAVYDISPIHKLSWSGIYGNDKILFDGESDKTDISKAGLTDTVGHNRIDVKQAQYATGVSLKSLWSENKYSILTAYVNNYHVDVNVDENFTRRSFGQEGNIESSAILNKRKLVSDNHDNATLSLKGEFVWNYDTNHELNLGTSISTGNFLQTLYAAGDSSRYFINGNWSPAIAVPKSQLEYNIRMFENYKWYVYANDKIRLFNERLILNLGLRYDYFSYSDKGNISPRISGSYYINPSVTSINFAYGEYYQTQNYPTYGDREHADINKYLENTHARHFIIGVERILDEGLKFNIESYLKTYDKIPISEEFIHFNNPIFRSNKNLSVGKQKVYGIDLLLQQKLAKDYFGTLSYSRTWTKYEDPRIGYEGKTFTSDYDFPHVLTIIFGKRFKNLRTQLDEMPFFIKFPSYLLPFSDDMEISFRWRYASGKPYTPKVWTTGEQYYEGETRWSAGTWKSIDEYNSARYPAYHRLDLAFNSRFNFEKWSIAVFLSIQNLYNRKNIAAYDYNSDGTIDNIYQFAFLPVVGVDVRF